MKKLTKPIVLISHTLPEEWVESLNGKCQLFVGPKDANTISPELLEHLKDASGMYTIINHQGKFRNDPTRLTFACPIKHGSWRR
jgi:hypothetical protein